MKSMLWAFPDIGYENIQVKSSISFKINFFKLMVFCREHQLINFGYKALESALPIDN